MTILEERAIKGQCQILHVRLYDQMWPEPDWGGSARGVDHWMEPN